MDRGALGQSLLFIQRQARRFIEGVAQQREGAATAMKRSEELLDRLRQDGIRIPANRLSGLPSHEADRA